ncbi:MULTISPECIES: hypothetical protein [unclassified Halorubrum]|jgi:hypothetical protein|uniref:hypothetical protein n=1 Tax=unclassified Halorubrum TaxID=2642239 RepID=UPI0010F98FB0|nr:MULTISPECIES: hypothetical protein [unclassified Halorubrum]TKX42886.1 hypothetical protein EXE50_12900 [Halorubrum sp. ARQ200]TKX50313.1 hypothetical protein EXE49_06860 [Halorubrum sp. ASP121]
MTDDAQTSGSTPEVDRATAHSNTYSDRAYTWLSRNGLYVWAGISVVVIALGVLAIPLLAFGSLAAIGGEESILAGGTAIVLLCTVLLLGLAVVLLSYAYLEVDRRGVPFVGDRSTQTLAYDSIRTVETVAAGIFIGGFLTMLGLAVSVGNVPTILSVTVLAAAIGLPVTVLVHAAGRFVLFVADSA